MTQSVFDRSLSSHGSEAVVAAGLVRALLARRRWTVHDRGDRSRLFAPPSYSGGEGGLRIHYEGRSKEAAREFALKQLRVEGATAQADEIGRRLAKLDPRTTTSNEFPSVSLVRLLETWETGGRDAVRRDAIARRRLVGG